jgi:hypothetical protein
MARLEANLEAGWITQLASLILALGSLCGAFAAVYHPARILLIANWSLMAVFFGFFSVVLFRHLGCAGQITSGRLFVSVSLHLLLAFFALHCLTYWTPSVLDHL